MNISQVNFLIGVAANTCSDLKIKFTFKKEEEDYCGGVDLPVFDSESFPKLGELFVEVEVQADFVLHFDTLMDNYLLEVGIQSDLLQFFLKLFNPNNHNRNSCQNK